MLGDFSGNKRARSHHFYPPTPSIITKSPAKAAQQTLATQTAGRGPCPQVLLNCGISTIFVNAAHHTQQLHTNVAFLNHCTPCLANMHTDTTQHDHPPGVDTGLSHCAQKSVGPWPTVQYACTCCALGNHLGLTVHCKFSKYWHPNPEPFYCHALTEPSCLNLTNIAESKHNA